MRSLRLLTLLVACLALGAGCSNGTGPGDQTPPSGDFDAQSGTFAFAVLDSTPEHPFHVRLIGSQLELNHDDGTVALDVVLHNLGPDIHAPLMLWLGDFDPAGVDVANPDEMLASPTSGLLPLLPWGFDYSGLVGDDDVLSTGESSAPKHWIFRDPGLVSFSFGARLQAGQVPGFPIIAGLVWVDQNGDGHPQDGEPPWPGAKIVVERPDGGQQVVHADAQGRYRVPGATAGLYRLTCDFSEYDMIPPLFTTPNPLTVLLLPDDSGELQSFLHADFGLWWAPPEPPPVMFTDLPPDSLHFAPWQFLDGDIAQDRLGIRVAFSGCQPQHPWSFYISGGFMESEPVQVRGVLVHQLDEDCDAAFETTLHFDLRPLKQAYVDAYGPEGMLTLDLVDFHGDSHPLEYWIASGQDSLPPGDR